MEEFSDAGSIPASSIICTKEGPNEVGKMPWYYADASERSSHFNASATLFFTRRGPTKLGRCLGTKHFILKCKPYYMPCICI